MAPRLRTASPTEADGSFFQEGPVPSVGSIARMRPSVCSGSERQDGMTMLLSLIILVGTLSWLVTDPDAQRPVVVR